MSLELITIAAVIVIAWLLFTAIFKILKTSLTTGLTIVAILIFVQVLFDIKYQQVWQKFQEIIARFLVT